MPLILITGISTSGKSTIAKELAKHGYEAYDTEHDGISAWYNKETDERAAEFGQIPERTKEWMDRHEWRMSLDWVRQKADEATDKPIFLCGGGANEPEVRALCDKVIWLKTNETTIRSRVNNPRDHTYGTEPHELERILEGNERKEAEYLEYGAIMIDATKPLHQVVNEVIKVTKTLSRKNMQVDPRLNDIDDCLYRVAIRVFITQNDKVLLVKEADDDWWALPGGGIDHSETIEGSLVREIEEELGVPADKVSSDFEIVHYNIGNVVNNVPRINLFFKATVPEELLRQTEHVAGWKWFTKDEFLESKLHTSFDRTMLAKVIFSENKEPADGRTT